MLCSADPAEIFIDAQTLANRIAFAMRLSLRECGFEVRPVESYRTPGARIARMQRVAIAALIEVQGPRFEPGIFGRALPFIEDAVDALIQRWHSGGFMVLDLPNGCEVSLMGKSGDVRCRVVQGYDVVMARYVVGIDCVLVTTD